MRHQKRLPALAACLLLVLAACGGGGSGSPSTPPPETSVFIPGASGGPSEAAVAKPTAGSVTQSSDTVGGVTANAVHATVSFDDKGLLTADVRGSGWQFSNSVGMTNVFNLDDQSWAGVVVHDSHGERSPFRYVAVATDRIRPAEQVIQEDDVWVSFTADSDDELYFALYDSDSGTLNDEEGVLFCPGNCIQFPGDGGHSYAPVDGTGDYQVVLSDLQYLDHQGLRFIRQTDAQNLPADDDYLVMGYWLFVPEKWRDVAGWPLYWGLEGFDKALYKDMEYGVFVDGNDPFRQENLSPLTGSATYTGWGFADYIDTNIDPETGVGKAASLLLGTGLLLDARLTANFESGTVSGSLSNFRSMWDSDWAHPTLLTDLPTSLTLKSASIGNSHSGFFTGDTSMTFDGGRFVGKWGGQFYSNGEADGKPGSAAGTFGAATADGSRSIIGAFGAYKE